MMKFLLTCVPLFLLQSACVIGFRNAEQGIDDDLRRVYVPPAVDNSSTGGASSRVSYAVRRALSLNTKIQLSSLEDARLAVDVQIQEQLRAPAGNVIDCISAPGDVAGSKAFGCGSLGIAQATLAAEDEALTLYAIANLVDLEKGKNLRTLVYRIAVVHPTVSADESERNSLKTRPDLHALRYFERHDNSVESLGNTIARDVLNELTSPGLKASLATPTPTATPAPSLLITPIPNP